MTKPPQQHTVALTSSYLSTAKAAGITEEETEVIVDAVSKDPKGGDLIKETNGVRKTRVAKPGKGKRGAWRVFTAWVADNMPVYLLAVIAKNKDVNISKAGRNTMAKLMAELKAEADKKLKAEASKKK
jgi:hypothetical protein